MKFHSARLIRSFAAAGAVLAVAACFGGGDKTESGASADDVDEGTSIEVTDKELAAFKAPADSAITAEQVEKYLKTSLLQYDYIRKEAPEIHQKVAEMEKRGKDGGVLSGLRNMADGMGVLNQMGQVVGGSFIRSARALGYNPAEMEYVRERMAEVSGYLMTKPLQEQAAAYPQMLRQQAEEMRKVPGMTEEQINEMLQQADQMEKEAAANAQSGGAAQRNYEVLRKARSNVTDPMWTTVGFAGGAQGILALTGLGNPQDAEAQKKFDEFRQVYTDALANKVSPGMENQPASN